MNKWLKRAGFLLLLSLWAAAGLQIWAKKAETKEKEVAAAFSELGGNSQKGIVQYYGELKKENHIFMLERREEYLRKAAAKLGILDHILVYRTYEDDSQTTILKKEGAKATTTLRLVSWRENGQVCGQSLYADVKILDGTMKEALEVRKMLKQVFDVDMEKLKSSAGLEGKYLGKLDDTKKEEIAENFLKSMKAEIVEENKEESLYTIYAHTPYLNEYLRSGKKRVNISLSMYYDKTKSETQVMAALPLDFG